MGQHRTISSGEELKALQAESIAEGITVLDMADWRIIPAENLVAAFQASFGLYGALNQWASFTYWQHAVNHPKELLNARLLRPVI
jgi:hypothetical protein